MSKYNNPILIAEIKKRASTKDVIESCEDTSLSMRQNGELWGLCPLHDEKTPSFEIDPNSDIWHCFGCGKGGDVIEYVMLKHNLDFNDAMQWLANFARIDINDYQEENETSKETEKNSLSSPVIKSQPRLKPPVYELPKPLNAEVQNRLNDDLKHWQDALGLELDIGERNNSWEGTKAAKYLIEERGLEAGDLEEFFLGYDKEKDAVIIPYVTAPVSTLYKHIKAEEGKTRTPTINDAYPRYFTRRCLNDTARSRYLNPSGVYGLGKEPFYLESNIYGEGVVFVVEGQFDALAIESVGFDALALCGCGRADAFVSLCEQTKTKRTVVVWMDKDESGQKAAKVIDDGLTKLGIPHIMQTDPKEGLDDPAQWLENGPSMRPIFTRFCGDLKEKALKEQSKLTDTKLECLGVRSGIKAIKDIFYCTTSDEPTPTGIQPIDDMLGGGIRCGLTTIGAVPSTGKTTLAVQMAENMARQGRHVLFVTIEQGELELTRQSVVRALNYDPAYKGYIKPVTADLADSYARFDWDSDLDNAMERACKNYAINVAPRLHYMELDRRPKFADIAAAMDAVCEIYGEYPVLFVDYLQLIEQDDPRQEIRQAVNATVTNLRIMAKQQRVPVIVIVAFKRESYYEPVSLSAPRESGGIEYTTDIFLGMQPQGWKDTCRNAKSKAELYDAYNEWKGRKLRSIEVRALKHRGFETPATPANLIFNAPACTFTALNDVTTASSAIVRNNN